MRDWSRHDALYERLQAQNLHENIPVREMVGRGIELAEQIVDWLPVGLETVLDVGAKDGYTAELFAERRGLMVTAVDIDADCVRKCLGKGVQAHRYDMHFMQFADESFDLVYASNVVEHSVMPILCLGELARVCKEWMLIRVPAYPSWVRVVSHWAVVPPIVWLNWFSALGLCATRCERLKYGEDAYLLKKYAHWPRLSWDEQLGVMKAIRELHDRNKFVEQLEGKRR